MERLGLRAQIEDPDFRFDFYDLLHCYISSKTLTAISSNTSLTILTRENGDQVLGVNKGEMEVVEVALDPSCPLVGTRISDQTLKIRKA